LPYLLLQPSTSQKFGGFASHGQPAPTLQNAMNVTQEQRKEYEEAFSMFDKDGDGVISAAELQDVLNSIGADPTIVQVRRLIADVDVDGDGALSPPEFVAFMASMQKDADNQENVVNAFKVMADDRDETNKINMKRMGFIMQNVGEVLTAKECENLLASAASDIDGNGDLNYRNFIARMMAE